MDFPENKLTGFIQENEKAKWRPVNNHNISDFTEDDIKRITKNYSTRIGRGAFGQVYQGVLDDGSQVAVKKYICHDFKEGFAKEVTVHCQINHKNVVRLLGYCAEENALTLVTEFICRGNLDNLLHDCDDPIPLDMRLRIAVECAEVLDYMHSMMYQPIIHGDIKPANILIDDSFGAKLSDFGISRLLSVETTQYTENVIGSRGYADPEFLESGRIDPKNDVYSFGVVLLELITRKRTCENGITTDLKRNFIQATEKGKNVRDMFDAKIINARNSKILDGVGELVAHCLRRNIEERPDMKDVCKNLRTLSETNSQKGQEKTRQRSLWGTQKINQESTTNSTSTSTSLERMSILNIFNRNAQSNSGRNKNSTEGGRSIVIFTKKELEPILHASNIIGIDSAGPVYKGALRGQLVAVKKSYVPFANGEQAADRLFNYVANQFKSTHNNIVKLIGVYLEIGIPMLVHEFVPKGGLDANLHGIRVPLDLDVRLNIAAGSAQGVAYMHSIGTMHGNLNPANILLGDNFEPKISDFGIPSPIRVAIHNPSYVDPVSLKTGSFTAKSDVYSFGVVLLELLTRKKAASADNSSLVFNFLGAHREHKGAMTELFDTELTERGNLELLDSLAGIAVECLNVDVDQRPEMKNVAERLHMLKESRNRHNGV